MDKKTAVILFNLGGPSDLESVQPFLYNLFSDKAIISLPNPLRYFLAKFISKKRAPVAAEIYSHIGGKSPILEETKKQAEALEKELGEKYKVFISMRYWHPFSYETMMEVKEYNPDKIILLPLYPQFSTATTASSFDNWDSEFSKSGLTCEVSKICCYPADNLFIESHVNLLKPIYEKASGEHKKVRILFSAHGLPKKTIKAGDPYQSQVEMTAGMIINKLGISFVDYVVCYQSKVGRLEWLEPSTEHEILRACHDNVAVIIVPIAFVSEHSETLVELDIEYKKIAEDNKIPGYYRVPTLSSNNAYIKSLSEICKGSASGICNNFGKRVCADNFSKCIY